MTTVPTVLLTVAVMLLLDMCRDIYRLRKARRDLAAFDALVASKKDWDYDDVPF